jgi:hypothetical protein
MQNAQSNLCITVYYETPLLVTQASSSTKGKMISSISVDEEMDMFDSEMKVLFYQILLLFHWHLTLQIGVWSLSISLS